MVKLLTIDHTLSSVLVTARHHELEFKFFEGYFRVYLRVR